MEVQQTIEIKKLWCNGCLRGFSRTTHDIYNLECKHQNECPCFESNKSHEDYIEPMKAKIDWCDEKAFFNCEFYKLQ